MDSQKEVKMNPKEQDIVPGGSTREEARELNRPKGSKPEGRWKRGALNTAVAGTAAFLGGTLAEQVYQAVNNPPLPRVTEAKPDTKRDIPPEGIRFDAPVEPARNATQSVAGGPVLTKRLFIPF